MNRIYVLLACLLWGGVAKAQLVDLDQETKKTPPAAAEPVIKIDKTLKKVEWVGDKGSTLRTTLTAWAAKERWDFIWDRRLEEWDYELPARVVFTGSIEDAFQNFVLLYQFADIPLNLKVSPSQRLFVVGKKGDSK